MPATEILTHGQSPERYEFAVRAFLGESRQEARYLGGLSPETKRNYAHAVTEFFDQNEAWLVRVLELGKNQDSLRFAGSAADAARMIISGLEGAMLVARPYGGVDRFKTAAVQLLASLASAVSAER